MCRKPISYHLESLEQMPGPSDAGHNIVLGPDIKMLQEKMAALFAEQKAKGGIIDLEAEKNKYLVPEVRVLVYYCIDSFPRIHLCENTI